MTTSRKAAISLLIAVLLFGGFSVLAFGGLFKLLETRFYNPSITEHLNNDIAQDAKAIDKFMTETRERFSETLKTDTVRRSFLSYQNADDVSARSRIYSRLIESFDGVQWVRFIDGHAEGIADADGQRLLFSTYGPDVLNGDETFPVYSNYDEPDLPYAVIAVPEDGTPKYTFDERAERVIFSFPLYDSFDIYWGTALFSLSIDAVSRRLASEGKIKHGEDITVVSNPAGLMFRSLPGLDHATEMEGSGRKVLISTRTSQGIFVGRLVNEEVFLLPAIMKIILLLAFFLTTYLIIFLLFNLRQDPLVVVQNRLKQLQISLIEQFYERKTEADWARWIKELEHRREEVRALLKRGIKADSRDKTAGISADMDVLINKSWDELLAMLGSRRDLSIPWETGIDEEKISSVLERLLEARRGVPSPVSPPGNAGIAVAGKIGLLRKASEIAATIGNETVNTESGEEIEILEELDKAEKYEDLETVGAPSSETGTVEDELINGTNFREDLEIVSPFSTMVFDSSGDAVAGENGIKEGQSKEDQDGELNTDATEGLPLIATPFSAISGAAVIETLEPFNSEEEKYTDDDIIREKEGVHYISENVLTPTPRLSANLNPGFKELVDEVTK